MGLSFKPSYLIPGLGQAQLLYDAADSALDFSGDQAEERLNNFQGQSAAQRAAAKRQQYALLGELKGPKATPQQEARIKALEEESKLSLINDPNFQSPMRQATSGGAAALSSIQNKQAATGAVGGFQNVGSISDVYDRVGGQLAEIAQNQNQVKEQKRDTAADLRQSIADAEIAYQNSITNAKIAIESGDAQAAQTALAQAYQAREAIQNRTQQMVLGLGGMAVSAFAGAPAAPKAAAPTTSAQSPYLGDYSQAPTSSITYGDRENIPYYQSSYGRFGR
jgi:hypothetical protein